MGPISIYSAYNIRFFLLLALVLCCHTTVFAVDVHSSTDTDLSGTLLRTGVTPSSLVFVPNRGQLVNTEGNPQRDVAYSAVYNGVSLFFRTDGVSYVFTKRTSSAELGTGNHIDSGDSLSFSRMDMALLGANPDVQIKALEQTTEYFNFYYGHCPEGIVDVPGFTRLIYQNVYDNIDLVFYSHNGRLKYDFIVRPGGNPHAIRMRYRGAEAPAITDGGILRIQGRLGTVYEETPFCYQQNKPDVRAEVGGRFRLDGETVGFDIDNYDAATTLVIDPGILWATYLGGTADDGALAAGTDAFGNIAVSGYTESINFPVSIGAIQSTLAGNTVDLFIAKLNSTGERVWTTYYGGNTNDYSGVYRTGLAVTPSGSIVITGHSSGGSFPITLTSYTGGLTDAFLLKISSSGQRQWATFCGGSDADYGRDVATDANGNVYMVGVTWSTRGTFSTQFQNNKSDLSDAFIVKYSFDGTPLAAIFYGGNGSDVGNAITLDPNNHIIIAGETGSTNLPMASGSLQSTNAGGSDAFVAKFYNNSVLQLQWGTFLGGSGRDWATGIATDVSNSIIVGGSTASSDFPVSSPALQSTIAGGNDAFIAKISSSGQQRLWATYYGGSGNDEAHIVRVDNVDNIVFTGETTSTDLLLSAPTYQENLAGASDAFLVRLISSGQPNLATYYGGNSIDVANALALSMGTIVIAGHTQSSSLPVSIGAIQRGNAGGADVFIAKIGECNATVDIVPHGSTIICRGSSVVLDAGEGYSAYLWSNGATTRTISVDEAGTYAVTVIGVGGCQATDSIKIVVNPLIQAAPNLALCQGEVGVLSATASSSAGDLQYQWSPSTGLSCDDCPNPHVVIEATTTYTVTVTDNNGCRNSTTITVSMNTAPVADAGRDMTVCPGAAVPLLATGGTTYKWSPAAGLTCTECQGPLAVFPMNQPSMTYYVVVTGDNGCSTLDSVTLFAKSRPVAVAGSDTTVCEGTKVQLAGSGGVSYFWEPAADFDCPTCQYPTTIARADREYTLTVTDESGCMSQDRVRILVRPTQPLSSSLPKIDFGQLGECESNAVRSTVITNTSTEKITIESVVFTNSNIFSHVAEDGRPMPSAPLTLAPGSSDTLYFMFVPQTATAVSEHVTLRGTPCNIHYTLELTGRKTSIAVHTGNVAAMDFGSALACEPAPRDTSITIHNAGSSVIAVRADIAGPFKILSSDISPTKAVAIKPGEVYRLKLRFESPDEGVFAEELRLPYESGFCSGEMRVPVIAAVTAPVAGVSASDVEFPMLLGCQTSTDTALVFSNTGNVPVTITNVDDNDVFQLGSALPIELQPGESRSVTVRFRPSASGIFNSVLTFTGEPCNVAYGVAVSGTKQGVGFEVADAVSFPALVMCRDSEADTMLTIANISGDDVEGRVKNVVVDGPFTTTIRQGDIIGSGSTRDFGIRLAASGAGVHSGTITLVLEPCDVVKTIVLHAEISEAAIAAETAAADFGRVPLSGTSRKTVYFRNTGHTDMRITSLAGIPEPFSVAGTDPALPVVLAPNGVLAVEVQYNGADIGYDTAQVQVVVEEPCVLAATVEVTGETVNEKFPVIAAAGINFGVVQVRQPKVENLIVRNTGSAEATVDNVVLSAGATNYSLILTGFVPPRILPPGDSLVIPVRFMPKAAGHAFGKVEITGSTGSLLVDLTGIGSDQPTGFAAVSISDITADVSARNISIPVYLTTAQRIEPRPGERISVNITIRYNPNVFNFTTVTGGDIWGSITRENNRNFFTVRREFTATPQSGDLLFRLNGDVLLGDEKVTEISIDDVEWHSTTLRINGTKKAGLLTVTGICEEGGDRLLETTGAFGITSITPNPSGGRVEIVVSTVEHAETHLEVYTAGGRLAYEKTWVPQINIQTGSIASTHAFVVDTELPSGLYFVVLSSPARKATARMIIEK